MSGGTIVESDALEVYRLASLEVDRLESPVRPLGIVRRALQLATAEHFVLESLRHHVPERHEVTACKIATCSRPRRPWSGQGRPPEYCDAHSLTR